MEACFTDGSFDGILSTGSFFPHQANALPEWRYEIAIYIIVFGSVSQIALGWLLLTGSKDQAREVLVGDKDD